MELSDLDEFTLDKLLCEKSFYEYIKQAWQVVEPDQPFIGNWHIEAMCAHGEYLARTPKDERLFDNMIWNVPPGTMKSLTFSVLFPTWVWGPFGWPGSRWMFASYDHTLSTRDSLKRRTILQSDWYQERWGDQVQITGDQNLKIRYHNSAQGWMFATSVNGAGVGEHPDWFCIDDPHNVKQAESDIERQIALDWLDSTMGPRGVIRGVRRILTMQRLKEGDATDHLMAKKNWIQVVLPMRYEKEDRDGKPRMKPTPLGWTDPREEEGELLWPDAFDEKKVSQLEDELRYHVAGQLQQRPAPREGHFFKVDKIGIMPNFPPMENVAGLIRYWDKAGSAGKGKFSVGLLMARMHSGYFVIFDVKRGQWSSHERNGIMVATARQDRDNFRGRVRIYVEQEPGSGGKESAEISQQMLAGFPIYVDRPTGNKEVRADPLAAQVEAGRVMLVKGDWNGGFLEELRLFPASKYKDQVDAASAPFNILTLIPMEVRTEMVDEAVYL